MSRLGDPQVAEALLPLLGDLDSDVRLAAAQALGTLRNTVAVEALVVALTDEERTIREAAATALGLIDPNWPILKEAWQASPRLELLLEDPRAWVSAAASQVLDKLRASRAGTSVTNARRF